MFRKIISVFLILFVTLVLSSGCAQKSESTDTAGGEMVNTADQTEVPDAEDSTQAAAPQISVTVPEGWEEIQGAALAQYMKGGASFIVTCDTVPDGVKSPDEYVEFAELQFKDTFADASFTEPQKITVDGMEGRDYGFTTASSGMEMKFRIVYLIKGSQAYTLTCADLTDDFDNVAQDYQSIIESFQIQ